MQKDVSWKDFFPRCITLLYEFHASLLLPLWLDMIKVNHVK